MDSNARLRFVWKPLVFAACLIPFGVVVYKILLVASGHPAGVTALTANPIEYVQDHFGQWGLRFIMIALAVTPLRKLSGAVSLARFRRMLGLFAFFYVFLHFLVWLILDQQLAMAAIAEDIFERPYITLGMIAVVLLTAMAATSTIRMRQRLKNRWQTLHNSIYVVGILAVWHYWWQVKSDIREPLVYAVILAFLLGYRIWDNRRRNH